MRKFWSIIVFLTFLVLLTACTTTNAKKANTEKLLFPIQILSGEVNLHIILYSFEDNTISPLATGFATKDAKERIKESNKEIELNNSYKEIVNKTEFRKEGEMFYYTIEKNKKITVVVSAITDTSTILCSNKIYNLSKSGKDLILTFYK